MASHKLQNLSYSRNIQPFLSFPEERKKGNRIVFPLSLFPFYINSVPMMTGDGRHSILPCVGGGGETLSLSLKILCFGSPLCRSKIWVGYSE